MYFINLAIVGQAPIKFNRMADPFNTLPGANSGRKQTKEQLIESAKLKIHRDEHGLFFPGRGLKSAIVKGCSTLGIKDGKKPLWPFMKAVLYTQGDLRFGVEDYDYIAEDWTLNKTMQMIPNFRPTLDVGWKSSCTLAVLDDGLSVDSVRASVNTAGLLIGIGSGRPECGRFSVEKWEMKKELGPLG